MEIKPVGIVKNNFEYPVNHHEIKKDQSIIVVEEEYNEALSNIEFCKYLDIVFYFHKSEKGSLSGQIHSGETRGVFASRSPRRPNSIGVTTVKFIKREGNTLYVSGLDAINGSPVIDIKCCDTSMVEMHHGENDVHNSVLKTDPRIEINNLIARNNGEQLLLKAGQIHGHFCPGLAMGVMAATRASKEIHAFSDGMEDVIAITETNNCFSDGVQYVTGCTFGNNALIFKDIGKTAFTLSTRDGNGVRVCSRHESRELIRETFPDFERLYQQVVTGQNHDEELKIKLKKAGIKRSFAMFDIPFDDLFTIAHVKTAIPEYASIYDSFVCAQCGESVMGSRVVKKGSASLCYTCSNQEYNILSGNGISLSK